MTNLKLLTPSETVGTVISVSDFAEHVRVGSVDLTQETAELERALRAATDIVQRQLSLALTPNQQWEWTPNSWAVRRLPLTPVQSVESIHMVDRYGVETLWSADNWRLDRDAIVPTGLLATIPPRGYAKIVFTVGYETVDVPPALLQAVLMLGAYLYEHRSAEAPENMVQGLIAPFKPLRIGRRVCL